MSFAQMRTAAAPRCPGNDGQGAVCGHVAELLDPGGALHLQQSVARYLAPGSATASPWDGGTPDCAGVELLLGVRIRHPAVSVLAPGPFAPHLLAQGAASFPVARPQTTLHARTRRPGPQDPTAGFEPLQGTP